MLKSNNIIPGLNNHIQSSFLEEVRKRLPEHISLSDELAEILNISRDSAYRRIRGETVLSLEEVKLVCNHYKISLDALLAPSAEMVSFQHRVVNYHTFPIDHWLRSILSNLEMLGSFPEEKEMVYATQDIPVFHYFTSPLLSSFKLFVWMKTILQYPDLAKVRYKPEVVSKDMLAIGPRIWDKYAALPSTEIWSHETYSVTLRQIEFYYECGLFEDPEIALKLCDEYLDMMKRIQSCALNGTKDSNGGSFRMFKNELLITDQTILFKMGNKRVTYITHNTMNLLTTTQESFCRHTEEYLNNVLKRSVMLSPSGEKERIKYFNKIEATVQQLKKKME